MLKNKLLAFLVVVSVGGLANWYVFKTKSIENDEGPTYSDVVISELDDQKINQNNQPESFPSGQGRSLGFDAGDQFFAVDVPVIMGNKVASYNNESNIDPSTLTTSDPPQPKNMNLKKSIPVSDFAPQNIDLNSLKYPYDDSNKAATSIINGVDFDGNATLGGFYNIPADPHGASGPNHVVNVVNTSIQMFLKDGTLVLETSLKTFFNSLSPVTNTFDPKVLYDQYEDRWVVVTLERTDAPETSFVFLAVSDTSDPTGTWSQVSIDTKINIGGVDRWLDYPGFAVDEQAIYVTGNMFSFAGAFGGNRIVIVDKGVSGGFYDGGVASANIYDPIPGGFSANTHQPAHTFGTVPGATGTWIVRYSGLSSNVTFEEAFQIIRIDNPLGAISFNGQFVFIGEVDNTAASLLGGPQTGGAPDIDLSDRRAQNAVWRNNNLYVATVTNPGTGADAGQTTAYWSQLDTTNVASIAQIDGGHIGAEDLFNNAYTGYAAIAVNDNDNLIIGFTATSANDFPGSYYVTRNAGDPAGTVSNVETVRDGLAAYERTFGSGRNRWGDYSSVSVDPVDNCFWVYNKHAITQGTPFSGENGRWGTAHASVCTPNTPPVANNDNVSADEDSAVNNFFLTSNDTDVDGDDVEIMSINTTGTTGSVNLDGNNDSIDYDPNGQFESLAVGETVQDTFSYTAEDGNGGSDTATVTITINGENDEPNAQNDSVTTDEDIMVPVSVLTGDSDVDAGDTLSVTSCTGASNGSVVLNGNNCEFTPAINFNGQGSFDYAISDGNGGTDTASVTVTVDPVNDDPVAMDDERTTEENAAVTVAVLTNDSDPDAGDILSVTIELGGAAGTTGLVDLNFDDTITYDPNGQFESLSLNTSVFDSFVYTVSDGNGGFDQATVIITINGVNDEPIATNDITSTNEDTMVAVAVLTGDTDVDTSDTLSVTSCSNASNGTVVRNGNNCEFTPALNFNGQGSFNYAISDGNGGTDSASVTVTIDAVNDDPVVMNDQGTTDEETAFTTVNVLTNDSDPDAGDVLSVTALNTTGTIGLVVDNGDGTFDYDPNGQFESLSLATSTVDSFSYTVSDGNGGSDSATVSITINGINDEPMATNDNTSTNEDIMVAVAVLTGDTDVDAGDTLIVTSCSNASNGVVSLNGNNCEFTPAQDFSGQGSFDYAISDQNGGSDSALVTVTVDAVNDDPVAVNDNASTDEDVMVAVAVLTGDTDVDAGDTLIVTSCSNASNGVVSQNGNNCEFTPAQDFNGQGSFDYAISDQNGGSDSASVTVTVDAVNDDPVAVNDSTSTNEDVMVSVPVLNGDSDVDAGDALSVTSCSAASNGSVVRNGNNCEFTPTQDFNGQASFNYAISDGNGGTDNAVVTVTVNPIDDAPVAVNDAFSINEDSGLNVLLVTSNDTDIDSGPLNVIAVGSAGNGAAVQSGNNIEYTPNADYCGEDSFTYDLNGGTQATVTVNVNCVNDEPSMAVNEAVFVALSDIANPPAQVLACQFDFGPDNEDGSQAVNDMVVNIVNDPSGVITSVDVDNTGQLSYVFTGNAGVAEVTVALQDDGGTDNSGVDTSQQYTFTVNVQDYVFRNGFDQGICQ